MAPGNEERLSKHERASFNDDFDAWSDRGRVTDPVKGTQVSRWALSGGLRYTGNRYLFPAERGSSDSALTITMMSPPRLFFSPGGGGYILVAT